MSDFEYLWLFRILVVSNYEWTRFALSCKRQMLSYFYLFMYAMTADVSSSQLAIVQWSDWEIESVIIYAVASKYKFCSWFHVRSAHNLITDRQIGLHLTFVANLAHLWRLDDPRLNTHYAITVAKLWSHYSHFIYCKNANVNAVNVCFIFSAMFRSSSSAKLHCPASFQAVLSLNR